jgi:hypothetical protein
MSATNSKQEEFSFDFKGIKFSATQPGKETRKTMALVGLIVIIILALILAAIYFMKVNLLSASIFGGMTAIGNRWIGKGGRSP